MDESGRFVTDQLKTLWQYPLPQHALSRLTHRLARSRNRVLKNWLIHAFIRRFKVDLSEAVRTAPTAYISFNDFFTRALRPDARPVAPEPEAIACPVDGRISQIGYIERNFILQAKGRGFTTEELLGDAATAARFADGAFATLYLSPRDYHRVHMPLDGSLRHMRHIPGRLFSVNPPAVRRVPRLFARNERISSIFDTPAGAMAVVLVGALNVGSIETVWAGELTPPRGRQIRDWAYQPREVHLQKGAEAGRFNLGSTVVLLFERECVRWDTDLVADDRLLTGQRLGVVPSLRAR